MNKLWKKLSYLGIPKSKTYISQRSNILTNQINISVASTLFVILIIILIKLKTTNKPVDIGWYRVFITFLLSVFNLIFGRFRLFNTSKILLIIFSPLLLVFLPTFYSFVEEESYVYYPIIIIGFSIIPQLILSFKENRFFYICSFIYFLFLLMTFDVALNHFNPKESIIFQNISTFYFYYKLVPAVVFLFVAIAVFYLKNINYKFEKEISLKNIELDQQNEELKSTIEKLKMTQNQLVHSEKMAALGNLTSGISHEINNPLNFINGGAYFIEEAIEIIKTKKEKANIDYISELLYQSNDMISKGVKRASQIVNLLTVFSLEKKSEKQYINLNELLNGTLCFVVVKANNNIKIKKEFNFEGEVNIFHDEIHQALLNIFNNAIESIFSTPELENPFIKISTNKTILENVNFVQIEIFNTGKNIPENELLTIFEPFYSTKDAEKNPGLGLSVAYTLVKKHHGTIKACNKKDGISIKIQLPVN